jgi:MinD superfamily P-loop ATPase
MEVYTGLIRDLEQYFNREGVTLEEIRGLALKRVRERKEKGLLAITKPIPPRVKEEECTACGKCAASCIYDAIAVSDIARIDEKKCYGCGLCVEVCPVDAITSSYYR